MVVLALSAGAPARAEKDDGPNLWAKARKPSSGASEAIGGYSAGCVGGAFALPRRGAGWRVVRPARRRYFGHEVLVSYLRDLGRAVADAGLGPLAVGDLSMPRGGPAPSGHASHQSGLDVDLGYGAAGTALAQASVVDRPRKVVGPAWGERPLAVLRLAAADPRVARIFVHPAIKEAVCTATAALPAPERAWLRVLRPWWGHDDHFHVRLHCPAGNTACQAQDPIADGDGCAELAWWLDPARDAERAKEQQGYQARVGARPPLPAPCAAVLAAPAR
ncbi:MAG: penicillin-insensitive murein endopeptidase [Kofleriaceae bacterium]|nr:penicillin-insensitive murein endopeptidase [Kofleriaceae bacterium]